MPDHADDHATPDASLQDDSGLKSILSISAIYDLYQWLVGADRSRRWLAANHWRCEPSDRVLDIGCGTGAVLPYMPESIDYLGIDPSTNYIAKATATYGHRGTFQVGTATELLQDDAGVQALGIFDIVMCTGVLHHLSDQQIAEVLQLGRRVLAPGGRMVMIEPVLAPEGSWLAYRIVKMDRGQNVLTEAGWNERLRPHFTTVETRVVTDLLRIPFIHLLIECR